MTVKSIIDIPVNTSEFERFQALFSQYQKQLQETPGIWAEVEKEHEGLAKGFKSVTAALLAQNQFARELEGTEDKQEKHLTNADRLWTSIGRTTKGVAGSVFEATKALLKWSGILSAVGGLLGAGGLFGIDRMAANAAGQRRSALGLGLTTGEHRAFQIDFQRLVDPDAFLGWLNEMETDISKQGPAFALTGRGLTGETGQDAVELLRAIRELAKRTPLNNLGPILGAYGLDLSPEDQRRLKSMGDEEFGSLVTRFQTDRGSLGFPEDVGREWQEFTNQMERAKSSIFKTFVEGLAPLAGPLERLSAAFTHFLEVLLKSPIVEHAIDDVSHWLENFSGKLSAPKFLESVERFTSDVGALADALHVIAHPMNSADNALLGGMGQGIAARQSFIANPTKDKYLALLADAEKGFKLPSGMLVFQWQQESSSRFAPPDSTAGAIGPFQLMPDTAKGLSSKYGIPIDPRDPLKAALGAAELDQELLQRYKGDEAKALAAYDMRPGELDKLLRDHPTDWQRFIPKETREYISNAAPILRGQQNIKVDVNVTAPPGFSAVATASALAH